MALTLKQEKFCQGIINGLSGKDAYIAAYDTKGHDNTVYVEVTRLLARDDIQDRLKALRKPLEVQAQAQAITETERIKQILWEEIANARAQQDHAAIARYTDQLNKLNNAYRDTTTATEDANKLDTLDTSALQRIAKMA